MLFGKLCGAHTSVTRTGTGIPRAGFPGTDAVVDQRPGLSALQPGLVGALNEETTIENRSGAATENGCHVA